MQIPSTGQEQEVAPRGEVEGCDLVMALGGDGTTLAALRAAAPIDRPVLGVACGSLGALTAVTADRLDEALDRVARGDWTPRRLPALIVERDGGSLTAMNDLVLVRAAAGQVMLEVEVDGELFIRFAGDGLVIATPMGSSAYTMAAGGPVLAPSIDSMVLTPLAAHGGSCPPLVVGPSSAVRLTIEPGYYGARIELDGHVQELEQPTLTMSWLADYATLVAFDGGETFLGGLRRRRILMDSPRVLARDDRAPVERTS